MESSLGTTTNHQAEQQQQTHTTTSSSSDVPSYTSIQDVELFFHNALFNSYQATDKLMKSIEKSKDEALAKRALELFQQHYATLRRPWDHVTFMYGLGMIYMHFDAFTWAVKSFREAIYVEPSFQRSRDIHTRLGLIFKAFGRYQLSEKHFNLAINDTRPNSGTFSKVELKFHIAHLYEAQNRYTKAAEIYEKLLQERDLPPKLSANIQRQLGWIYYLTSSHDSSSSDQPNQHKLNGCSDNPTQLNQRRLDAALNCLNTSFRVDHDSETSYYLGRCLTNIGKSHEAFASYRSVIDREESTADTWCSIGVLYHQQHQHYDALQAYIRSVQFDKNHVVAWRNLGILYESYNQFTDALKCYKHALRSSPNDKLLQSRYKYIQKNLTEIEATTSNNSRTKATPNKLLGLEDLWNLESKTSSDLYPPTIAATPTVASISTATTNSTTIGDLTSNQNVFVGHWMALPTNSSSEVKSIHEAKPVDNQQRPQNHQNNHDPAQQTTSEDTHMKPIVQSNGPIAAYENKPSIGEACVITRTNDCSGPSTIATTSEVDSKLKPLTNSIHIMKHDGASEDFNLETNSKISHDFKLQSMESKDFCFNQVLTIGTSKDSGISSDSSTYADCALPTSQTKKVSPVEYLSAEQVIQICKNSPKPKKFDINLLDIPPSHFPKLPPYPHLPPEKLYPSPGSVFLETKKELTSKNLQEFCQSNPISIIRNIATVLKLDLGLFSTKALVESDPEQQINIIAHPTNQNPEVITEDVHSAWACGRQSSISSISRYAAYQFDTFRESLQEERDSSKSKANHVKESETESNEPAFTLPKKASTSNGGVGTCGGAPGFAQLSNNHVQAPNCSGSMMHTEPTVKKLKKESVEVRHVRTADKIDLSNEKIWRPQLNELNKLPHFLRCVSASNMLTHLGTATPGINTIMMRMHVPGCRLLGNQALNNFCPININTGPGDFEWFAVSNEHERALTKLCNKFGYDLFENNWWPRVSDLHANNIPVYRFSQRPGDLVWVNSGTFYWVQAAGWSNSIHWHVGPLCAKQFRLSAESFELNKFLLEKSEVPMIQLTWNMVMNINIIADDDLFKLMLDVLQKSLKFCIWTTGLVEQIDKEILLNDEDPGPRCAKYCSLCEGEIFNITFIRSQDNAVHCVECARRSDELFNTYVVKQEYNMRFLTNLYSSFVETKKKFQARQVQNKQQQNLHQQQLQHQQQKYHKHQKLQQKQKHQQQAQQQLT